MMSYISEKRDDRMVLPERPAISSRSQVNQIGSPLPNSRSENLSGSLLKSTDTDIARLVNRDQFREDHYEMNIQVQPGRVLKKIFDH